MRRSSQVSLFALLGLFTLLPALAAAQAPVPAEAPPAADTEKAAEPAPEDGASAEGDPKAKKRELKELESSNKLPARDRIVERRRRGQ
jgi:hypothetical protein